MSRYNLFFLMFLLVITPLSAQTDVVSSPTITADNIHNLQSVMRVEFDQYPDIISGWFVVSPDGRRVAVRVGLDRMIIFEEGIFGDAFSISNPVLEKANIIDAVFSDDGNIIAVVDERGLVTLRNIPSGEQNTLNFAFEDGVIVQSLWLDDQNRVWLEILTADDQLPMVAYMDENNPPMYQAYAPADDLNALVRIGRVLPPYVVTSSPEGDVKLWNLEAGEAVAMADVGDIPAVFGQISPNGQFLVWRDPMTVAVNLLNFETGENVIIAELNGIYFQAFYTSDDGSVVWAVDEDFEPRVVAWMVATGERIDLGEFRACSRVPDMIRMSHDMTTLVIGCDTGLDIWRVVPEGE